MADGLELRVARAEAVVAVSNLIGRYAFLMHGQQWARVPDLFAQHRDDVSSEVTSNGVYVGIAQIRTLWGGFLATPREVPDGPSPEARELYRKEQQRIGRITVHQMTTPVIEIARDAQTAKAAWLSPGMSTMRDANGDLQAAWQFGKITGDFIVEGGEWRIWHLHSYAILRHRYEVSWVKDAGKSWFPASTEHLASRAKYPPSLPTTYHRMYDPEEALEMVPPPPEPYDTW